MAPLQYTDWLDGPTFTTAADPLDQNEILLGIGADLKTKGMTFSVEYKGSVATRTRWFTITGKFVLPF